MSFLETLRLMRVILGECAKANEAVAQQVK
jgi:hypothetical protein